MRRISALLVAFAGTLASCFLNAQSDISAPAVVTVSLRKGAEHAAPIGVNDFGDAGGTSFAAGNIIPGSGFEPMSVRRRWRVLETGVEEGRRWVTLDGAGITIWDLVTTGYLNGADYRVYRIVDSNGDVLPWDDFTYDLTNAAAYAEVTRGQVPEAGTEGLPLGGWVDTVYAQPTGAVGTRFSLDLTDSVGLENGQGYYYIVTAINDAASDYWDCVESDPATATEVFARPEAGLSSGPYIGIASSGGLDEMPRMTVGGWFEFQPVAVGATGTVSWELLTEDGQPYAVPAGTGFNPATGNWSGNAEVEPGETALRLRLTADNGTVERRFVLNAAPWTPSGDTDRPQGPSNVQAVAGDGLVHLSWDASPDSAVVGYRVYRSKYPRAEQRRRVYLAADCPELVRGDYIHFEKRMLAVDPDWSHPRVWTGQVGDTWSENDGNPVNIRRVAHPGTVPEAMEAPGESCLEVEALASSGARLRGPYLFFPLNESGEADWYGVLEPGRQYVYEAWMRQDGMSSPTVHLGFISQYQNLGGDFTVGSEWELHRCVFTAPEAPTEGWHGAPSIQFSGTGSLYVDNIRLVEVSDESDADRAFVANERRFAELMASQPETGEKGILRSMYVLMNQSSMASLLTYHPDDGLTMDWYQSASAHHCWNLPFFLEYALMTGDSAETRMKPWLNVSSNAREDEWLMLMEYLSAPINPENPEDVAAKPWAYLRYQQRGVATPWTDEFPRIYVEFANETWHNGAVEQEWFGWSSAGAVHQGGLEFGLYAKYVGDLLAEQSPWFVQSRSAGQLSLVMGSNYNDYAEIGIPRADRVDGIGHTTYVGPTWETGDTPNESFTDHGVQATLLGYVADMYPNAMDNYRRYRERLAAQGIDFELLGYEGGPSGYSLPGTASAAQVEISEQYGKSMAMAVAALDAWLGANANGLSEQAFLGFGPGEYWSTHVSYARGGYRHVPFLAQIMRNRHASGDMITSEVVSGPEIDWNGATYPLLGTYAFREGSKLMVFLLSRKLDGVHDGQDFGDGSIEVTLELPAAPTGTATLYSLSGDPRDNNRSGLNIDIRQQSVELQQTSTLTLPSGAIYLYVVDTGLPAEGAEPGRVDDVSVDFSSTGANLSWTAVEGASGYRIYRSSQAEFVREQVEAIFESSRAGWLDPDAVGGSTFYYRIAAINDWGEGLDSPVAVGGRNTSEAILDIPVLLPAGIGNGQVFFQWERVAGATGYRLGYRVGRSGAFTWLDVGDVSAYLLTGVPNGVDLYWSVQAYGPEGRSASADALRAVPRDLSELGALLSWDFTGGNSYESSVTAGERVLLVDAEALVRGPGMIAGDVGYHPMDDSYGFFPIDDSANFGAAGGGSLENAVERDLYVGFSLSPRAGSALNFQELLVGVIDPYVDPDTHRLRIQLRYRIGDEDWANAGEVQELVPQYHTPTDLSFDLSGEAALQHLTEAVEFRFYFYSPQEDHRWCRAGFRSSSGNDLVLTGSVEVASAFSSYENYRAFYYTSEEIANGSGLGDSDDDADGVPAILEYVWGRHPRGMDEDPVLRLRSANGGFELLLPSPLESTDVSLYVEQSSDLGVYTELARFEDGQWSGSGTSFDHSIPGWVRMPLALDFPCFFRVRAADGE